MRDNKAASDNERDREDPPSATLPMIPTVD